ncbi:MAG: hypothetical protein AB2615_15535, partial [Candidatus Thiodiazotropha sp.]
CSDYIYHDVARGQHRLFYLFSVIAARLLRILQAIPISTIQDYNAEYGKRPLIDQTKKAHLLVRLVVRVGKSINEQSASP